MAVNVSGTVQVGGVSVSSQVEAGGVNATATINRSNTVVSASVEHSSANVSATAQTRSVNACANVNPHVSVMADHSRLQNLDYEHANHTGFQKQLDSDNAGTGISITTDSNTGEVVISNTQTSAEWGNIEGNLADQTDLNNILTDLDNDITAVEDDVEDIQELIPAQATPQNQLADKDFVNSSIATSTATFRETYNVVTDLHLSTSATHQQVATALGNTVSVADNNDYCFVEIPTDDLTPTETLQVDRYKYNGSSWSFEYTLNNSGYTSAQWKAINSGITSGKVTQYDDYATSKQDTLIAGTNITIGADGKTISSDIPQATSQLAGKVLLGVAGGAATYESVENRLPICYPTTASDVKTSSMLVKSSVSDNGKIITERGFVYDTSPSPVITGNKLICDVGSGMMNGELDNLTQNTTYHIRSYGINSEGTTYGAELTQATTGSPIPAEYQLVEYLETSGNYYQYIDSGIAVRATDVVIADWLFVDNNIQFGARISGSSDSIMIGVYSNNFIAALGPQYNNLLSQDANRHKFTLDAVNRNIYIDDVIVQSNTGAPSNNLSFYLFARNPDISSYNGLQRAFQLSIIRDGSKIRDFYPVYRIADQVAGMYDIVNDVFYTNQGSGEFTVGPDAVWSE